MTAAEPYTVVVTRAGGGVVVVGLYDGLSAAQDAATRVQARLADGVTAQAQPLNYDSNLSILTTLGWAK